MFFLTNNRAKKKCFDTFHVLKGSTLKPVKILLAVTGFTVPKTFRADS